MSDDRRRDADREGGRAPERPNPESGERGVGRRAFLRAAAAAGTGLAAAGCSDTPLVAGMKRAIEGIQRPELPPEYVGRTISDDTIAALDGATVPKRPFGRSGVSIAALTMGMTFDTGSSQLLLRRAVDLGVTSWDTGAIYEGGLSEEGIGRYFRRNPAHREQVFLTTKSQPFEKSGADITKELHTSLSKLKTDYIDLWLIHAVEGPHHMPEDIVRAGVKAREAGKIRLFGFSAHAAMAGLLHFAAESGWVDGILIGHNVSHMADAAIDAGVEACHRAGIGMITMKLGAVRYNAGDPHHQKVMKPFIDDGYIEKQAQYLGVMTDPRMASAAVAMKSMDLLAVYAAAAMNRKFL